MTKIEAMTIGAMARLRHQLDHDVARHLSEMREQVVKTLAPQHVKLSYAQHLRVSIGRQRTVMQSGGGVALGRRIRLLDHPRLITPCRPEAAFLRLSAFAVER